MYIFRKYWQNDETCINIKVEAIIAEQKYI